MNIGICSCPPPKLVFFCIYIYIRNQCKFFQWKQGSGLVCKTCPTCPTPSLCKILVNDPQPQSVPQKDNICSALYNMLVVQKLPWQRNHQIQVGALHWIPHSLKKPNSNQLNYLLTSVLHNFKYRHFLIQLNTQLFVSAILVMGAQNYDVWYFLYL